MSAGKDEDINYFLSEIQFPEVKSMFSFRPKSLESIKDDCIVVLDTNVLLLPYTVRSKSLDEIKATLQKLIDQNKLLIPGQVVREFAKNRPNKISELFQQVSDHRSKVNKIETPKYPLLEKLPEFNEVLEIQNEINGLIKKYTGKVDIVLQYIKNLNWDDHVSSMYSELFSEQQVLELKGDNEEHKRDFQNRSQNNIPPGFKDKSKPDGGIGDFLIWKTILQIGSEQGCDLIFVSGDEKNDWFHKSMNQPLYPRYELIQEYKRISGGATFKIISLSGLLELYGAAEEAVHEIKTIEDESNNENNHTFRKKILHFAIRFTSDNEKEAMLFSEQLNIALLGLGCKEIILHYRNLHEAGENAYYQIRFKRPKDFEIERIINIVNDLSIDYTSIDSKKIRITPIFFSD